MTAQYWIICAESALEEAGISATNEQIAVIADVIEGDFDNYGMAHGFDVIGSPVESQAERELRELKNTIEKRELWENSTVPCKRCCTQGVVRDGWGRDCICPDCDGKGRVLK